MSYQHIFIIKSFLVVVCNYSLSLCRLSFHFVYGFLYCVKLIDLNMFGLFLLLFLFPWNSDLRKHWRDFHQRMFCLCSNGWVRSVTQSCPTLCDPMDCSLPGSSVHGILQERILEWVALASSRGSSQPRDQTIISYISCIGRQRLSCSTACGIFLDQGSNPCLLHWHEDSLPLSHKEAPVWFLNIHLISEILSKHLLENIACDRICSNIFAHE